MQQRGTELELSASDLANHLACAHLTALDRRVALRELARPSWSDPALDRLKERGKDHERAYVEHLRTRGLTLVELEGLPRAEAEQRTLDAARNGVDVIVQAALRDGRWVGFADVLLKRPAASPNFAWSYEVQDTKLAQETRGGTVLQLCLYADLLTQIQGEPATTLCVVKPGADFSFERFDYANYEAYYRHVKARLARFVESERTAETEPYPEPVEHCEVCRWWQRCDRRRRDDDHLSLVAGMRRMHADELRRQDRPTLAIFARAEPALDEAPQRGHRDTFEDLHLQAQLQLKGREEHTPKHKLLPPEPGRGLARLPVPSAGDVFLDFEGDPFVGRSGEGGLEYLLGYAYRDDEGATRYEALWAFEHAAEKLAFERFVDFLHARLARQPDFYVYHYAPYEPAALRRLASRHATRERELDVLLRGERFVDLYAVVRQGLRASVESYSLKPLEEHFGYVRAVKLREEARPALERLSAALEAGAPQLITTDDRAAVEGYNKDDCLSLIALQKWLETLRAELVAGGATLERPPVKDGAASEKGEELGTELQALFEGLVAGIPIEADARTDEQRARWLLAHMIEYFQREDRVGWWEYFARRDFDDEELRKERKAIVGLTFVRSLPNAPGTRKPLHRYSFPAQEVALKEGDEIRDVHAPTEDGADKLGTVHDLDLLRCTIDIEKIIKAKDRHPRAVHAFDHVPPRPLPGALQDFAAWVAEHGIEAATPEHRAARDLLLALHPRTRVPLTGALQKDGEASFAAALRITRALDGGVLAIQGPPGSGKTYCGARLVVALARDGRRIGVTANSHKVVRNLLDETLLAAREERFVLECTHKPKTLSTAALPPGLFETEEKQEALAALERSHVVGGVAWLWAAREAEAKLDYLFIDEAGQMSLAQVLACARAAKNLILLGDPQQLQQPQRGAHPEGSEVSALTHLLRGEPTIAPERGLFLAETWRLPPPLCAFTSKLFYEGRLHAHAGCELQALGGPTPFAGAGLFRVEVEHTGNQSSSPEEVAAIERIVAALIRPGVTWTDMKGVTRALTREDLLVIAPYNAQVAALARSPALADLHIGTVDLFQGQERAVVLYSLTSSSPADAPRGISFLYDLHRLNVATSRARGVCIVVAAPALFEPQCRTPEDMRLANGLCALAERARPVTI